MRSSIRSRMACAVVLRSARCRALTAAPSIPACHGTPTTRPACARRQARSAPLLLIAGVVALSLAISPPVIAQCILVQERGGPEYAPHFVLHFGESSDVPLRIACSTSLDKELPTLCVPIYAYNLWGGAAEFEFALRSPVSPTGFDQGPEITTVEMNVSPDTQGTLVSLKLAASAPVCGPALLGCLRLPTAGMAGDASITFDLHQASGRCAVRTPEGDWRRAVVDGFGARIGGGISCATDGCDSHTPVDDLRAAVGERANQIELTWTSGSGPYTLLRSRADGRAPRDPWDGDLVALIPASVTHFQHLVTTAGVIRYAAWSVTRGPYGNYYAGSNIECGSLASILVQLPVGVAPRAWTQVKGLYR